jgi:hypothetical protein
MAKVKETEVRGIPTKAQAEKVSLKAELEKLEKKNLKQDGKAKRTANSGELERIKEIRRKIQANEPVKIEEVMEKPVLNNEDMVALEREIRIFVKKGGLRNGKPVKGGFRKGLSEEQLARGKELLAKAGRTKPEWNMDILVPGFDYAE